MDSNNEPDLSKAWSRWSAPYWAMMHGIAASLDAADWSILCALYCHLPNIELGKGRLELLSGRSPSTVKASRKRLRSFGLTDYSESTGGFHRDSPTKYICADIRSKDAADAVLARIHGANVRPGQLSTGSAIDPVPGQPSAPYPVDDRPPTGPTIDPKVRNGSSQVRAQEKSAGACGLSGADAPGIHTAGAVPVREAVQVQSQGASPTSTAQAPKGMRVKGQKRSQSQGLTPADKQALSALPGMERYLFYGRDGLYAENVDALPPASGNWRGVTIESSDPEIRVAAWKANHFATYYWWLVSKYNSERNAPCALPESGFGRIAAATAKLMDGKTNNQVLRRLYKLYLFFNLIRDECSTWMTSPPVLNEAALQDATVTKMMQEIEQSSDEELTARWAKAGYGCVVQNGVPVNPQTAAAA